MSNSPAWSFQASDVGVFKRGKPRQVGEVTYENDSPVSRSEEDAPRDYSQFSIELLAKQDHESKGVG